MNNDTVNVHVSTHKGHNFKGARPSWLVFSNYCVFP